MVPTPRALALETEIRQVLATMERLSSSPIRSFDPVSSETTMRLVATGYLENLFLTKVMCEVAARAPKMQIEVRPPDRLRDVGALENGGLDFLVGWNMKPAPSLRSRVLFVAVSAACAGSRSDATECRRSCRERRSRPLLCCFPSEDPQRRCRPDCPLGRVGAKADCHARLRGGIITTVH